MSRSLQASEVGIKQIRKAMKQGGFSQKALAESLGISRSVITVLFRGEAIDRANFEELCKFLELDWRDIRGEDVVSDDLNRLVQEVKQKIAADVTERCGTMRVLDMTQPVDLDRIYTDVNIIKDVTGRRRIGYDEVMEVCTREHFDRFLVGTIKERVKGFEAVEEFQKLVVLGKPGAGKTTFMKYLAMSCLGDRFHGELVPIFVTLKAYAEERGQPSLENYILTEFQKREVAADVVKRLLKEGRALILLDGLDEVKLEDDRRVKQDIDRFSRDWLKNRFAITCRIAAREYQFEKFTEVEVADFDNGQIETFVNNWFRERDESKAERMLERLEGNEPVKELAKSPLLLTLLCLVFGERNDFPPKRSELYKEGLEVLMKKWDAKRNIEREIIYKHLSPQNKEDMLGQIAFNTFVNSEYFFRQEDLQRQIKDYICNLPEASADPDALRLDSEVVLKAIEHHHGLLVERARNIYSFSHLTFQEYFAAREIERERHFEILIENIANPRWKEVLFLTLETLRNASYLLLEIKNAIDSRVGNDPKVQDFLQWLEEKSSSVSTPYESFVVRAFYYYLALSFEYNLVLTTDPNFDYNNFALSVEYHLAEKLDSNFDYNICPNLKLDDALKVVLVRAMGKPSIPLSTTLNDVLKITDDSTLKNRLQDLLDRLPEEWSIKKWKTSDDGKLWIRDLRSIMINCRNIGHALDSQQIQLLRQHYASNLFLLECLNTKCYVDIKTRKNIKETLLQTFKGVEREIST
ncbi:MAG: hypothetical protein DCF20_14220 [Pseudanabaena sp.]|nr:MAG: hypothetical protein DCF20_14220 [Pseudanabaena sp.]